MLIRQLDGEFPGTLSTYDRPTPNLRLSLMLSIAKNFLFIHIPKTGGSSVQTVLAQYSEDSILTRSGPSIHDGRSFGVENARYRSKKHSPLSHYWAHMRGHGELAVFDQLYKFAIIRNPWDRCISWYFSPHLGKDRAWSREDFLRLLPRIHGIGHYTTIPTIPARLAAKVGLNSSYTFFRNRSLTSDINRLLRFESLSEDFDQALRDIGLPPAKLPHRNASRRESYRSYLDDELRQIIARKYREEIRYGNYEF